MATYQPAQGEKPERVPKTGDVVLYRDGHGVSWPAFILSHRIDGFPALMVFGMDEHFNKIVPAQRGTACKQWQFPEDMQ